MQMAAINVQRPHWRVALLSVIKTHMIVSLQRGKLISTGKKKVEYFNETYAVSNIKVETLIAFFFFFLSFLITLGAAIKAYLISAF